MQNAENRLRVQLFNAISVIDDVFSETNGKALLDSLFRKMAARVAFDTFLGVVTDEHQKTSVIRVARVDA